MQYQLPRASTPQNYQPTSIPLNYQQPGHQHPTTSLPQAYPQNYQPSAAYQPKASTPQSINTSSTFASSPEVVSPQPNIQSMVSKPQNYQDPQVTPAMPQYQVAHGSVAPQYPQAVTPQNISGTQIKNPQAYQNYSVPEVAKQTANNFQVPQSNISTTPYGQSNVPNPQNMPVKSPPQNYQNVSRAQYQTPQNYDYKSSLPQNYQPQQYQMPQTNVANSQYQVPSGTQYNVRTGQYPTSNSNLSSPQQPQLNTVTPQNYQAPPTNPTQNYQKVQQDVSPQHYTGIPQGANLSQYQQMQAANPYQTISTTYATAQNYNMQINSQNYSTPLSTQNTNSKQYMQSSVAQNLPNHYQGLKTNAAQVIVTHYQPYSQNSPQYNPTNALAYTANQQITSTGVNSAGYRAQIPYQYPNNTPSPNYYQQGTQQVDPKVRYPTPPMDLKTQYPGADPKVQYPISSADPKAQYTVSADPKAQYPISCADTKTQYPISTDPKTQYPIGTDPKAYAVPASTGVYAAYANYQNIQIPQVQQQKNSNVDLLAGLDFNISQVPLDPVKAPINENKTLKNDSIDTPEMSQTSESSQLEKETKNDKPNKDDIVRWRAEMNFEQDVTNLDTWVSKSLDHEIESRWKVLQKRQESENANAIISVARCYPARNRCPDSLPYDRNRFELPCPPATDDYINASKTTVTNMPPVLITQAPLVATMADFWTMVMHSGTETIICLMTDAELQSAGLNEGYWKPEFATFLRSTQVGKYWTERIISLSGKDVSHIQLTTSWPSIGFGDIIAGLADLAMEIVRRRITSPIVIHCLTGIGRSGVMSVLLEVASELLPMNEAAPVLVDVLESAGKLAVYRKNPLKDRLHLEFTYRTVLRMARTILPAPPVPETSVKEEVLVPQITENKDPLEELDPLWKMKIS